MANHVAETFTAKALAANGAYVVPPLGAIGGFFCTTAGTLSIADSASTTMVASFAVSSGQWYPLPFACPIGATVTLAGGAAGTLGVC